MSDEPRRVEDVIRELLDDGMVRIVVDADHPDCFVPPQHKKIGGPLALNLSYNFKGHMMRLGPNALSVTLTFGGEPFRCEIPWSSVLAVGRAQTKLAPKAMRHLRLVSE
mgnify:CR=1 FL=1